MNLQRNGPDLLNTTVGFSNEYDPKPLNPTPLTQNPSISDALYRDPNLTTSIPLPGLEHDDDTIPAASVSVSHPLWIMVYLKPPMTSLLKDLYEKIIVEEPL